MLTMVLKQDVAKDVEAFVDGLCDTPLRGREPSLCETRQLRVLIIQRIHSRTPRRTRQMRCGRPALRLAEPSKAGSIPRSRKRPGKEPRRQISWERSWLSINGFSSGFNAGGGEASTPRDPEQAESDWRPFDAYLVCLVYTMKGDQLRLDDFAC